MAHADAVVGGRRGRDPVEHGAGAGDDVRERLAARWTPRPVGRRVVVRALPDSRVGLAGELPVGLLTEILLDRDRKGEPLGQDDGGLPGAPEGARDDADGPGAGGG